ncbi:uncharacterized protein LOC112010482 [Quercus suber]|uniref:uncharacterized protein LOC112010482 n=1 Tax=Quercus suber TaxID=58331 RepID=UPI0032DF17F4
MAIKIDLEKAYDKIEWSFIREMLIFFNFPATLIDLIMSCVSSVSTSLLFNGGCLDSFCPSRGIRQGDPLSPYLFILCMEFLGHLIEEKCEANLWSPVRASRSGPSFSHLFFADDLVLFANADQVNCNTIKSVLNDFCLRSGQRVSVAKSRVFFSPNVGPDQRILLSDILGFNSTPNLGKYLGYPLKHAGDRKHDFDFVLDRVKKKLAGWKANLLSMAGRVVLIQASSSTIPSYVMQSHIQGPLPQDSDNMQIKNVLSPTGWNWSNIPFEIPPEVKAEIQAVPVPRVSRCSDKLAWKFSSKGDFDMRSAYLLAIDDTGIGSFSGSWIWKLSSLPRIQLFIWKCMQQSIGVKDCLAKRGIPLDTTCPLCHSEAETILHALRDCNLVRPLWQQLGIHCLYSTFFSQDIRDWLITNGGLKTTQNAAGIPWNVLFSFGLWLIWKQRNQGVFNSKSVNVNLAKVIAAQPLSSSFVPLGLVKTREWCSGK